ncbi:hypothetical protein RRG08_031822 [Elysia crispata]|uniref:Uncharacterized protein n=1 Tax=Elysia crispata TaxID=231223 RepID=A0AAE0Y790_9GAST|nr:hypothetical protein RRG08_031822 [Elysia crispata]
MFPQIRSFATTAKSPLLKFSSLSPQGSEFPLTSLKLYRLNRAIIRIIGHATQTQALINSSVYNQPGGLVQRKSKMPRSTQLDVLTVKARVEDTMA